MLSILQVTFTSSSVCQTRNKVHSKLAYIGDQGMVNVLFNCGDDGEDNDDAGHVPFGTEPFDRVF